VIVLNARTSGSLPAAVCGSTHSPNIPSTVEAGPTFDEVRNRRRGVNRFPDPPRRGRTHYPGPRQESARACVFRSLLLRRCALQPAHLSQDPCGLRAGFLRASKWISAQIYRPSILTTGGTDTATCAGWPGFKSARCATMPNCIEKRSLPPRARRQRTTSSTMEASPRFAVEL
jgi:hypothetical protein